MFQKKQLFKEALFANTSLNENIFILIIQFF